MRKLSTGEDSTLANWILLCTAFFGKDSPATTLMQSKVAEAEHGEDEEVIADEPQLLRILGQLHLERLSSQ